MRILNKDDLILHMLKDLPENASLTDVISYIQKFDELEEKDRWIKAEEDQPKTGEQVLVTLGHTYESDYTIYSIARYIHFDNGEAHWCDNTRGYLEWDKYSDGHGGDSSYKVLAWMPLPKQYDKGYHSVLIQRDDYDITHNPKVRDKYPTLYQEVLEHDKNNTGSWYHLTPKAYDEWCVYVDDQTIDYMS